MRGRLLRLLLIKIPVAFVMITVLWVLLLQTTGDLKISLGLFDFIPASTGSHGMS